jgi:acyl-coenzyme A thioesterase PaaI-like protein
MKLVPSRRAGDLAVVAGGVVLAAADLAAVAGAVETGVVEAAVAAAATKSYRVLESFSK